MDDLPVALGSIVAGRYLVEELVREDADEVLLRAKQIETDAPVLLVLFPHRTLAGDAAKACLASARRVLSRLRGEHLLALLDAALTEDGLFFLAYERLEAEPLDEAATVGVEAVAKYMLQVARALEEVHACGLVHGSLEPKRLLRVKASGLLRLDRAGVSGVLAKYLRRRRPVRACSAPEELVANGHVGKRTDIYALGACMYGLLAGRPLFLADGESALVERILKTEPSPIHELRVEVPLPLSLIVSRCLRKDARERFRTATELRLALEHWVEVGDRALRAMGPDRESIPPSMREQRTRSTARFMLFAASCAFVLLLGTMALFVRAGTEPGVLRAHPSRWATSVGTVPPVEIPIAPVINSKSSIVQGLLTPKHNEPVLPTKLGKAPTQKR